MEAAAEPTVLEERDQKTAISTFESPVDSDSRIEEEILDYTHEIPTPNESFLQICAAVDPRMSETLRDAIWAQLFTMTEKVDLDDETIAYVPLLSVV